MCLCVSVPECACVCVLQAEHLSKSQPAAAAAPAAEGECQDNTKPVTSSVNVNSSCDDVKSAVSASSKAKAPVPVPQPTAPRTPCPYRVIEICNSCWVRSKEVVTKSMRANQCSKVGHEWIGVSFLILPCKKLLANLPATIPRNLNFSICWNLVNHKRCRRADCSFAHCDEEIAVWKWMVQNHGKCLYDMLLT